MTRHIGTFFFEEDVAQEQIDKLADLMYQKARSIPELVTEAGWISFEVNFQFGQLEQLIAPYLPRLKDCMWLTYPEEGDPEYERIHNHRIEWCGIAPSEKWETIMIEETIEG